MEEFFSVGTVCAFFVLFFAVYMLIEHRKQKKMVIARLKEEWGNAPEREYKAEAYESITRYFEHHKEKGFYIDDITWNDLEMDEIFCLMNRTYSSLGEEHLYHMLRTPVKEQEILDERDRLANYWREHEQDRLKLQYTYCKLGRTLQVSISDYLYRLHTLKQKSIFPFVLLSLSLIASIIVTFIVPTAGIFLIPITIGVGGFIHYKESQHIEPFIISLKYMMQVLNTVDSIADLQLPILEPYVKDMKQTAKAFRKFKRGSFMLSAGKSMSGAIEEIILEYVRMMFHIDLIKFYSMLREVLNHEAEMEHIMEVMGTVEATMAIGSFRDYLPFYCRGKLEDTKDAYLSVKNEYHPLINEPVANSIDADKSILITGSNASGKSTFLRSTAICALFAQTVDTIPATAYRASFFQIYSSMALKDNLLGQESYYMVEIKSLKRILDHSGDAMPLLCFVDEVLRGTNTVERIAASSQVLKSFVRPNVICFAATHDIELTYILEKDYDNYHFQEEIKENDVLFDYELQKGRAVSRNAIKLLSIIGYDDQIIKRAEKMALQFTESGEWIG